jgi:hypothetical protein
MRKPFNISGNTEMADFDAEEFITSLDGMGMKLTAIPLPDGRIRVSRWCMMNANEHTEQIHELWTRQIGDDQDRINVLAAHLTSRTPREVDYISSGRPHDASSGEAAEDMAPEQAQGSGAVLPPQA